MPAIVLFSDRVSRWTFAREFFHRSLKGNCAYNSAPKNNQCYLKLWLWKNFYCIYIYLLYNLMCWKIVCRCIYTADAFRKFF